MYAKLFSSLLSSSVWSEDSDTCKVWITLIALADREGFVFGSPSGIARICALSVEKVEAAIEKFLALDRHSSDKTREPDRGGKRVETVDGGWILLNYAHYRDLSDSDIRRAQYRASKRKIRGRSTNVNNDPQSSTLVHLSESSSEADTESKEKRERGRFAPPSVADVAEHISEKKYPFTAEDFVAYYASQGWKKANGRLLSDWKLACVTWSKRARFDSTSRPGAPAKPPPRTRLDYELDAEEDQIRRNRLADERNREIKSREARELAAAIDEAWGKPEPAEKGVKP